MNKINILDLEENTAKQITGNYHSNISEELYTKWRQVIELGEKSIEDSLFCKFQDRLVQAIEKNEGFTHTNAELLYMDISNRAKKYPTDKTTSRHKRIAIGIFEYIDHDTDCDMFTMEYLANLTRLYDLVAQDFPEIAKKHQESPSLNKIIISTFNKTKEELIKDKNYIFSVD